MVDMCLSGGADGADLQWGMTSGSLGYEVIHWSFPRHNSDAPDQELVVLSMEQLEAADRYLDRANKTLKRRWRNQSLGVKNLLRRNWYQVEHAERVYAVSWFEDGKVNGGTAWAVQMFLDRHHGAPCECYVFDQKVGKWFCWKGRWTEIERPPRPHGIFAGIGTRKLNSRGKAEIRDLMGWVKP